MQDIGLIAVDELVNAVDTQYSQFSDVSDNAALFTVPITGRLTDVHRDDLDFIWSYVRRSQDAVWQAQWLTFDDEDQHLTSRDIHHVTHYTSTLIIFLLTYLFS